MPKRGPKRKTAPALGVEPLRSQNVMVRGHRTSMRLEPSMWDALEEIARREGYGTNDLCTRIKDRMDEQARQRGQDPERSDVTLTSAVRVFIAAYFRRACTEDGHSRARHGEGDPFAGTPFDLGPSDLGKPDGGPPSPSGAPGGREEHPQRTEARTATGFGSTPAPGGPGLDG